MGNINTITAALAAGILLALMVEFNSKLASYTTPVFASWITHAVGFLVSVPLLFIGKPVQKIKKHRKNIWIYLGGIPGAVVVVLASITVNSPLSLSGSIALMLFGQVLFGVISDYFGWFGMEKRKIYLKDILAVFLILIGSSLIIGLI